MIGVAPVLGEVVEAVSTPDYQRQPCRSRYGSQVTP